MLRVSKKGAIRNGLRRHRRLFVVFSLLVMLGSTFVMFQSVQPAFASTHPWTAPNNGSIMLEADGNSECAVTGGRGYCWGGGGFGGLTSPMPLDSLNGFSVFANKTIEDISIAGNEHCAVADGKAYCWGDNPYGQTGDGTTNSSTTPVAVDTSGVLAGKTVTRITTGAASVSCAVADGKAYCWGDNSHGQLGDGTLISSTTPVAVDTSGVLAGKTVTRIVEGGWNHLCALTSDGEVFCWGAVDAAFGQLGNGGDISGSATPVAVDTSGVLAGKTVVDVTAGNIFSCALTSDGQAACWGYGINGQLGDGLAAQSNVPVLVDTTGVLAGKTVSSISSDGDVTCAVANSGAYCWGDTQITSLGDTAHTVQSNAPVTVDLSALLPGEEVQAISSGAVLQCFSTSMAHIYCWGSNSAGQLGNGNLSETFIPGAVVGLTPEFTSASPAQILTAQSGQAATIFAPDILPGARVWFGSQEATVTSQSTGTLWVTVPESFSAGPVNITITNPDGETVTAPNAFEYVSAIYLSNEFENTFGESGTGNSQFNWPEGVATDASGMVYVTDNGNHRIQVFSPDGTYVRQFGSSGTGNGQFDYVTAIKIGPDGNVYALDANTSKVSVFTKTGTFIRQFGEAGDGAGQVGYAEGMAINSKGDVYLTDCNLHSSVKIFKSDGTYLRTFGSDGSGDGQFDCSYGIATDSNDNIYVADANNYRIQVFDKNDNFIRKFGSQGMGGGQLGWVEDLTVDKSGNVLVADSDNDRIQVFTNTGAYLGQIGRSGTGNGQFDYPNSIAIGNNGSLYITDARNDRVQIIAGMPQSSSPASQPTSTIPVPVVTQHKIAAGASSENEKEPETEPVVTLGDAGEGTPLTDNIVISKRPTFSGVAAPFAEVVITIHSDPVVCKTTADAEGKWSCTLDRDLPAGSHHVTIELTNQDGTKTTLGPYSVTVKGGDTVNSDSSFVTGKNSSKADKDNGANKTFQSLGIIALAMLGLAVIIGTVMLIRRRTSARKL